MPDILQKIYEIILKNLIGSPKEVVSLSNWLLEYYKNADILFLHLKNIAAFKRVLPSKVFEYGALGKPIVAGVSGYSANFIKQNLQINYCFEALNHLGDVHQISLEIIY